MNEDIVRPEDLFVTAITQGRLAAMSLRDALKDVGFIVPDDKMGILAGHMAEAAVAAVCTHVKVVLKMKEAGINLDISRLAEVDNMAFARWFVTSGVGTVNVKTFETE